MEDLFTILVILFLGVITINLFTRPRVNTVYVSHGHRHHHGGHHRHHHGKHHHNGRHHRHIR